MGQRVQRDDMLPRNQLNCLHGWTAGKCTEALILDYEYISINAHYQDIKYN